MFLNGKYTMRAREGEDSYFFGFATGVTVGW